MKLPLFDIEIRTPDGEPPYVVSGLTMHFSAVGRLEHKDVVAADHTVAQLAATDAAMAHAAAVAIEELLAAHFAAGIDVGAGAYTRALRLAVEETSRRLFEL